MPLSFVRSFVCSFTWCWGWCCFCCFACTNYEQTNQSGHACAYACACARSLAPAYAQIHSLKILFNIIYTSQLSRLICTHTHSLGCVCVRARAWTISKNDSKFAWNGISFWVVNIENRYVINSIIIVLRCCVCWCVCEYEHTTHTGTYNIHAAICVREREHTTINR